ncbi:MAG: MtaA/CmuA family methyltransferase [Candidatus Verstraetearchaeota archaeon]|nr:MtaA/CmuA family methyltransferase [Candidatus Verstraetearchaeota archaeon]
MSDLRSRLLGAVTSRAVDVPPVASFTQTATVELMASSKAYWPKAHREAKPMSLLAVAGHTIAGLEAVRLPFSLTSEVATMGCTVDYHDGSIDVAPTVQRGLADLRSIRIPEPHEGVMGEVIEAVRMCRDSVGEEVPIIAGVTGPFTIAGHIRGINEILLDVVQNKELVQRILESAWQVSASFSRALADNGVDVLVIVEPTASLIGPRYFKDFVLPYLRRSIRTARSPVVLHICGNSMPLLEMMVETGASCLSLDQKVSIAKAKEVVRGRCSVSGNVDPVAVLQMSSPEVVAEECMKILSEGVDVLAPGCGLSPSTPLGNLRSMVRARDLFCGGLGARH